MTYRNAIAVIFLLAQLLGIVAARFMPHRYFAWAPHDVQVEYSITASRDGVSLDSGEIFERYRLRAHGWEVHAASHPPDIITRYERASDDNVQVELRYRVNGGPLQYWRWPR